MCNVLCSGKQTILIQISLSLHRYFNSRLDLPGQIQATYPAGMNDTDEMYNHVTPAAVNLAKVATLVARSLYQLSTNMEPPSDMVANETVVSGSDSKDYISQQKWGHLVTWWQMRL